MQSSHFIYDDFGAFDTFTAFEHGIETPHSKVSVLKFQLIYFR